MSLFGFGDPEESVALIEGCYTLPDIPGHRITESLGLIEYTRNEISGGDAPTVSDRIFRSLLSATKEKGANAVVNIRVVSNSYQSHGNSREVTYLLAYGDAVIAE